MHKNDVYGYVLVRVGFDKAVSADIMSDIFIKAYDNFDSVITSERSWIFTITKNTLIDYYRKSKSQNWEMHELDTLHDETQDSYHRLDIDLTMERVRTHIQNLSPKQKDSIELYYLHEQTTAEISQILGIREDAVRKNLSRGLKKLRKLYEE